MKYLFSLLFFFSCLAVSAQPQDTIDAYMEEVMHKHEIPGAALAIIHEGRVVHQQHYGLASLEHKLPLSD